MITKKLANYVILIVFLLILSSWGETAHREINSGCVQLFPKEMENLKAWSSILGENCSEADFRKKYIKTEFVKHFIDLDNIPGFVEDHQIEQDFSAACAKYGKAFLVKNGTLPWTTDSTYQVLVQDFKIKQWHHAALTAADLGHYVADGFMPLHTVANYDGQLSGQTGVHSRYEEKMIDRYFNEVHLHPAPVQKIDNVRQYVFSYLYTSNRKSGLLLSADKEAFAAAGDRYNDIYYQTFWDKTRLMTTEQLENATHVLASLIYSAWLEAGKPEIPQNPGLSEN